MLENRLMPILKFEHPTPEQPVSLFSLMYSLKIPVEGLYYGTKFKTSASEHAHSFLSQFEPGVLPGTMNGL